MARVAAKPWLWVIKFVAHTKAGVGFDATPCIAAAYLNGFEYSYPPSGHLLFFQTRFEEDSYEADGAAIQRR